MLKNPFIENSPVVHQKNISIRRLIKRYKETYDIDIVPILGYTEKISVYKCTESGYQFYHPFNIAGDSFFYEKLEDDWYYRPWKWEHEISQKLIKKNDKILEVGCGKGTFLRKISGQFEHLQCVGLELNKNSVFSNDKIQIHNANVEEFANANEGVFDIVCLFQVLEHITSVKSFIEGNIKCLKENGLLIICVPNNDSFIKHEDFDILNLPPHHMGLWAEESLRKIGEYFNLEEVKVEYEPLQTYHFGWYIDLFIIRFIGKYPSKIILKIIKILKLRSFLKNRLSKRAHKIRGHSILIVFKKATSKK